MENYNNLHKTFLYLVRQGIGHTASIEITKKVDWVALKALAERQGLSAIVLDGLDKANVNNTYQAHDIPVQLKLEWISEVLQNYETRYLAYLKAIGSLAAYYNLHGFKMMILKGHACGIFWPRPDHRPCGDIDIWLFGKQKEADEYIVQNGIYVDESHHHHTIFEWKGFTVENHYDFINVYQHKSHVELERLFKELGKEDTLSLEIEGQIVYLPSPNLYALFLIKHILLHFVSGEMTFRQLLDWAFFVKRNRDSVDWSWLNNVLEMNSLNKMFNIINAICVEELGFDVQIFPKVQFAPELKSRIVNDMFNPEFSEVIPYNYFSRFWWRYRHWKANEWKHELCFTDSMWSSFWSGVWGHLLKPASI